MHKPQEGTTVKCKLRGQSADCLKPFRYNITGTAKGKKGDNTKSMSLHIAYIFRVKRSLLIKMAA